MTINARVNVVIVNYGAGTHIINRLPAVLAELEAFRDGCVYIADNNSPNDDLSLLAAHIDAHGLAGRVKAFSTGANLGFAGGNNAAVKQFEGPSPDYVFFLNPDAWPKPGALVRLAETLKANPNAAIAAPRILDEHGATAISYFSFPTVYDEFAGETETHVFKSRTGWTFFDLDAVEAPFETDWVSGAAFLLRMEAAADPPMDEGYFLYFEETDMMRDLAERGWATLLDPMAAVVHIGGLTTGAGPDPRGKRRPRYWYESWARYFVKHKGRTGAAAAAAMRVCGVLFYYGKCAARRYEPRRPQRYLRDFLRYGAGSIFRVPRR